MNETSLINREVAYAIAKQGHGDLIMVVDAGFAIPEGLKVIDLSIEINKPTVLEVFSMLKKVFSVEKMILANQTKNVNPTMFGKLTKAFGSGVEVETIDHAALKEKSKTVKAVIRTGDFTAYCNVILVSGAGERWSLENDGSK